MQTCGHRKNQAASPAGRAPLAPQQRPVPAAFPLLGPCRRRRGTPKGWDPRAPGRAGRVRASAYPVHTLVPQRLHQHGLAAPRARPDPVGGLHPVPLAGLETSEAGQRRHLLGRPRPRRLAPREGRHRAGLPAPVGTRGALAAGAPVTCVSSTPAQLHGPPHGPRPGGRCARPRSPPGSDTPVSVLRVPRAVSGATDVLSGRRVTTFHGWEVRAHRGGPFPEPRHPALQLCPDSGSAPPASGTQGGSDNARERTDTQ